MWRSRAMKPVESIIILPSLVRVVSPALAFIRATAATCGFSDLALNDIEVAAEEALTNVIKHAFEGHSDETFKVSVRFSETDFFITIYEKGMPFSPERVAEYDPNKLENTLETDGLGVYLMKKMMDEVVFENLGRDGKSLTLVKYIKNDQKKWVVESSGNDESIKSRLDIATESTSYEIRSFGPEDALEISQCAYRAYGYTYEPYIYYPEQITEMNRDLKLRSFIAADNNTGEIMGHMAFKYKNPNDRIAEVGVAFVRPEFRKSGVFNALNVFCHEKANELNLFGTFVRAVTSHIGSQKVADAMGYQVCGVFLGLFPDDVDFKALTGKIKQKETGLLMYRNISEEGKKRIYVPLQHQDKISEIFRSLNLTVQHDESDAQLISGQSHIHVDIVPVLNVAEVEVASIGATSMDELKRIFHELCLKHVDAIFIHITMEDPGSLFIVQQCEQAGFFFCGVLPFGMNNQHIIILQYMNNLQINFDSIKPYSQSAVDLLNYVQACAKGKN